MANKDIKLNPDETLGHVSKIAATMAEVSVPGPVPPPSPPTSPIDEALNAVAAAAAEKAAASAEALATRGTEHNAASRSGRVGHAGPGRTEHDGDQRVPKSGRQSGYLGGLER